MRTTPGDADFLHCEAIHLLHSEALTNLIVSLKDHHSHTVTAFIGKAQMKTGDLFFTQISEDLP